jgi:MFS family permease
MSSSAATGVAPADATRDYGSVHALIAWLDANSLLILGLAVVAVVSLVQLPQHITQDTWLALVDGRYIAAHGIPQHDTLFAITRGTHWYDQQWLAQLALYGLNQIGGLALYGLVYVALTMAGFVLSVGAARALGASERHILWVLPFAGFFYFAGSSNVRTQGFAYALFSATLWLLARETRGARDRRVYLVFVLLILWGNLHGSVTLGVALAVLAGAVLLVQDLSDGRWRGGLGSVRARSVALIVASPVCLLINPYGPGIATYYRETVFNPAFSKVVSEWQPITASMALAVPFFFVAAFTVWLMGRGGRRLAAFDQLAMVVLAAAALLAVRNVAWYGLGAMALVPGMLTRLFPSGEPAPRRTRLNLSLVGVSALIVLVAVISIATKPSSWFARGYDARALAAVTRIAREQPGAKIWVDNRFADWLLWRDPSLAGRMGYDIRFELLTAKELDGITNAAALPAPHQPSLIDGYHVLVLDRSSAATPRLLARSGTDVVVRGHGVTVATWRPPS